MNPRPEISFCITCKGRLKHLMQTLQLNIADNRSRSVEFVLLDYSSPDGLAKWVRGNLMTHIEEGTLAYYSITGRRFFHMAHAKNIAHRLARGRIVCNLDADNFTGVDFDKYLIAMFSSKKRLMVRSPLIHNGTHGRIALLKSDFQKLGGYNEKMKFGWGFEDKDLVKRALAVGIEERFIPTDSSFLNAIIHDDLVRTEFSRNQLKMRSVNQHKNISKKSITCCEFIANTGQNWGSAAVLKNFHENIYF